MAYQCVAYIVGTRNSGIASATLNKAVYDPSDNVRVTILNICKRGILPREVAIGLIDTVTKDANYRVREYARKLQAESI